MTPKMVSNLRRSLSSPNPSSKHSKTHIRSISLPSRSHPLISQLKDHLTGLKSWGSKPDTRTSAWLCDGLTRLKTVHDYLDDVLHLPQTHDSLRHQPNWIEKLLEDFLRFVDVYGIFQTLVLSLKQELSAAQVAVRRKDDSKVESYVKAWRKLEKEMGNLVSIIRSTTMTRFNNLESNSDAELAEIVLDVKEVTVSVSTVLFNGVLSLLLPIGSKKKSWVGFRFGKKMSRRDWRVEEEEEDEGIRERLWGLRNKKGSDDEQARLFLKRINELEDCIEKIELGSERVFRSLITTRVSLLNVFTM